HHRPTAWTVFGESRAILAGDALQTLSIEVLDGRPLATALVARATQRTIAGQALDLSLEGRWAATVDECLAMIAGKTAAILSCSRSWSTPTSNLAPAWS